VTDATGTVTGVHGGIADAAIAECVEHLRALIRIPSVNPPGDETPAAEYCASVLRSAGMVAEVLEAAPRRGSCFARLPATARDPLPPLILLSHLDVVPVDRDSWSREPFGGELVDGLVWGRGAVDMKDMVAMELSVMLELARSGVPLKRDVIFAALADEEAGGQYGALHWVRERPDWFASTAGPAAAALNEVGGYSITLRDRRFYTIQVAEKGVIWAHLRSSGTPGHGSMPHADNAAVKLARAFARLAEAERPARVLPVVRDFFAALGLGEVAQLAASDRIAAREALERRVADPVLRRSLDAMLRDTVSPNVIEAGQKANVVPGVGQADVDVRTLPGTDQQAFLAALERELGDDASVEWSMVMPAVEWPADAQIVQLMRAALQRADPDGTPVPMMITPGTDAKALMLLGIPTYGFAPLRLDADVPFLSLFHGNDERVPVSALAFGLPVLYEVVERFAGSGPGS
jgi:acetylornithine deacetylase/succinyl-diaminopimelate desuccinylase-like protein